MNHARKMIISIRSIRIMRNQVNHNIWFTTLEHLHCMIRKGCKSMAKLILTYVVWSIFLWSSLKAKNNFP